MDYCLVLRCCGNITVLHGLLPQEPRQEPHDEVCHCLSHLHTYASAKVSTLLPLVKDPKLCRPLNEHTLYLVCSDWQWEFRFLILFAVAVPVWLILVVLTMQYKKYPAIQEIWRNFKRSVSGTRKTRPYGTLLQVVTGTHDMTRKRWW